jgi:hypothetical protein
VEVKPDKAVV